MAENFGLMDKTYFTPKKVILDWINSSLNLNCDKIEEFGNGVVYCKLFHLYFPNNVFIKKINHFPKNIVDYYNNFKVLQKWFDKLKIKKHIEVEKLVKKKLLDNLEFIQWMKKYFENMNVKENTPPKEVIFEKRQSNKTVNSKGSENLVKKIKEIIESKNNDMVKVSYIKSLLELKEENSLAMDSNITCINSNNFNNQAYDNLISSKKIKTNTKLNLNLNDDLILENYPNTEYKKNERFNNFDISNNRINSPFSKNEFN